MPGHNRRRNAGEFHHMNDNMDGDIFAVLFRGVDRPELANGSGCGKMASEKGMSE